RVSMIIPRSVEPGAVVETGDVDNQSVPLPAADRLSHPGIHGRGPRIFPEDIPGGAIPLAGDKELPVARKNPYGLADVRNPRDAGEIALDLGVGRSPVLLVFLLDLEGLRLVRNLAALHDAEARRNSTDRA